MARPLIEYIYSQVLPWSSGIRGEGRTDVETKVLSEDRENGEMSLIVRYPPGWQRGTHALSVEEEMYVLDGEISINGRLYGPDTYACLPAGLRRVESNSPGGCVALTFYDGVPNLTHRKIAADAVFVEYLSTYEMNWEASHVGDEAGLQPQIKTLRWDPVYDQKSTFILFIPPYSYPPDWKCPTLTHPCAEESFKLSGDITGPHGVQRAGSYFWRPAGVAHGPFGSRYGGMSIIRFRHGKHVNIFDKRSVPYTFEPHYRPIVPPELTAVAQDYLGAARY